MRAQAMGHRLGGISARVASRISVPIRDAQPTPGTNSSYDAVVSSGAPRGYRNVGDIQELDDARYAGYWTAQHGGFTSRPFEGDTQFGTDKSEIRGWSHPMRRENGKSYLVEADISGLPVRFITQKNSPGGQRNFDPQHPDVFYPSTTLGIGVVGKIPVDRIKNVWMIRSTGDRNFGSWDEFVKWRERTDELYANWGKRGAKTAAEDYGSHRPTGGASLDDMEPMFGPDIYPHPEWYTFGLDEDWGREAVRVFLTVHGNPGAKVTVYRAAPAGLSTLRTGDWVAIAEGYARKHAMTSNNPSEDMPVYTAVVEARHVISGGSDLNEWGYDGLPVPMRAKGKTAMRARALGHRPGGIPVTAKRATAAVKVAGAEVSTEALQKAAESKGYFRHTFAGVSYRATGESPTYECKPHMWLPEYVIEDQAGNIVGQAKTARGALSTLVRKADAVARIGALKTAEADTDGVMIALVPEQGATKTLMDASGSTEDPDNQHITLLYLGSIADAGGSGGRERLHRAVYDFAIHSGHDVLDGKANGWGVFNNPEEDESVLVALWDIPGIAEFRAGLKASCISHGVPMREENHGFCPHETMKYLDGPTTTIPASIDPAPTSTFTHVVISWGDDWQSVALTGSLAKTADHDFVPGEHPRGGNSENRGEFSKAPGSSSDSPVDNSAPPASQDPSARGKKKPTPPDVLKRMKARGDVYGHFLPAGKYQEGDPRNDPEFEARCVEKEALSLKYSSPDRDARSKPTGGQTNDLYDNHKDPESNATDWYDHDRHQIHKKILADLEEQAKTVPHDGKCLVMAGPSGAGKSTFLAKYGDQLGVQGGKNPTNYVVINPDNFKDLLPADLSRYPGLSANELASIKHEESSYLAQIVADRLMSTGVNVIFDVTLKDAAKVEKKYVKGHTDKYAYTVALVDGDMRNSLNNAGNRYKQADDQSGERQWSGRFLSMSLVEAQAPTQKGYRSVNAQEFVKFAANSWVKRAVVYDPYAEDKGIQDAKSAIHEALKRHSLLSDILRVTAKEDDMTSTHQTTEITDRIRQHKQGKITDDELVTYLTKVVKYKPGAINPHPVGTPAWYDWSEGGKPYVAGSFGEVAKAWSTGLLDDALFDRILAVFQSKIV